MTEPEPCSPRANACYLPTETENGHDPLSKNTSNGHSGCNAYYGSTTAISPETTPIATSTHWPDLQTKIRSFTYNVPIRKTSTTMHCIKWKHNFKPSQRSAGNRIICFPYPCPKPFTMKTESVYGNLCQLSHLERRNLYPTYRQPLNDKKAFEILRQAFPNREVVGIDCSPLIRQHGSLHCVTMQYPRNVLR